MRSLRLKNFRSLIDTGRIELRPLTVLVGANGSGKSSFLRFFPLLRQTYEERSASPLLWYGRDVDFGDFSQVVRRGADPKEITIDLDFAMVGDSPEEVLPCTSSTILQERAGKTHVAQYTLSCAETFLTVRYDANGVVEGVSVGAAGVPYSPASAPPLRSFSVGNYLVPEPVWPRHRATLEWAGTLLGRAITPLLADRMSAKDIQSIVEKLPEDSRPLRSIMGNGGAFQLLQQCLDTHPDARAPIRVLDFVRRSGLFFDSIDKVIQGSAVGTVYIGPFRAAPTRFYRVQELRVGHMDPRGENLAMFLRALSAEQMTAFSRFAVEHLGSHVRLHSEGMNVVIMLEDNVGQSYNLIDMGYGFSQVLPVVAQCWAATVGWHPHEQDALPSLIAVEQPEVHLHPHHQAKLADMFVGTLQAARAVFPEAPQLLIETHSDALISRLGELVELGKLASEDVTVLLFEQDPLTKDTTVRQSSFSPDGTLTNWPIGFFAP